MRDSVDVIVPFGGSDRAFVDLVARLRALELGPHDSLTIVDNSQGAVAESIADKGPIRVVSAHQRRSSYYARNRGAWGGGGTWLLFLDADVEPTPDIIDRYLSVPPAATSGVLVGPVDDVRSADRQSESVTSRYSRLRRLIDQTNTLQMRRPYAKTANCAVRRVGFEEVGGFADDIRSGGDADLCLRLQDAGWGFEGRPEASVQHRSRRRMGELLAQRSRHGSGAEWLEARYPGFVGPRRGMMGLTRNIVGGAGRSLLSYCRGDVDAAIVQLIDPLSNAAFEIGRRIPNSTLREQSAWVIASPRWWMGVIRQSLGAAE
jgi:cellulose synthase/poly-beta-1,6-N-acetylglucosamine synthase-like glycosyltransferase